MLVPLDIHAASSLVLGAKGVNVQNPEEVKAALDMKVETSRGVLTIARAYANRVTLPMIRAFF